MNLYHSNIPDIILIEPTVHSDERGFFMETYRVKYFSDNGINASFVQDNHAKYQKGALIGLHYQIKYPQAKLVRVISGEIFDVVVDIRRNSPTFGKWVGVRLSSENKLQIWIPRGFAHGYYVLSDWAEILYKTDDYYAPEWERTVLWRDPDIGINWPLIEGLPPIISPKDEKGILLAHAEIFEDF